MASSWLKTAWAAPMRAACRAGPWGWPMDIFTFSIPRDSASALLALISWKRFLPPGGNQDFCMINLLSKNDFFGFKIQCGHIIFMSLCPADQLHFSAFPEH